jgi:hypothetical protein
VGVESSSACREGKDGAAAPVNGKRFFLWKFVGKKVKSVSLQMGAIRGVMIVILRNLKEIRVTCILAHDLL